MREAEQDERDPTGGAADLGHEVPQRDPEGGERCQRYPEDRADDEHGDPGDGCDEQRSGDIVADHFIRQSGEAVCLPALAGRHDPAQSPQDPFAVDEEGEGEKKRDSCGDQPVENRRADAFEWRGVARELLREGADRLLQLCGHVVVTQGRTDTGKVAEILGHGRKFIPEVTGLANGWRHQEEQRGGQGGNEQGQHDGDGHRPAHREATLHGLHQRIEGEREERGQGDRCERPRHRAGDAGDEDETGEQRCECRRGPPVEVDHVHIPIAETGRSQRRPAPRLGGRRGRVGRGYGALVACLGSRGSPGRLCHGVTVPR